MKSKKRSAERQTLLRQPTGKTDFAESKGTRMKKLISLAVAAAAFCLVIASSQSAQAGTITLTLTGTGSQSAGPYYIYPYYFTIDNNGKTTTDVAMMCISFNNEIVVGESWNATEATAGSLGKKYEEAAYLENLASSAPAGSDARADAQWAAWYLFAHNAGDVDPADGVNITSLIWDAKKDAGAFANYEVFTPIDGTQTWGCTPQTFIGTPPVPNTTVTPEPSSYLMFGTGLLGLGSLLYKKRNGQTSVVPQGFSA